MLGENALAVSSSDADIKSIDTIFVHLVALLCIAAPCVPRIFRIELFLLYDLHVLFGRSLGFAVCACDLCEPHIIRGCDERQIVQRQRNTTINLIVILNDGLTAAKDAESETSSR